MHLAIITHPLLGLPRPLPPRAPAPPSAAFTLIELLTASTLTSMLLLGVYALFGQLLTVSARADLHWQQHQSAAAVADLLADAIRRSIFLPDLPIVSGQTSDQLGFLECTVGPTLSPLPHARDAAARRLRFTWGFPPQDPRSGALQVQTIFLAATRPLHPPAQDDQPSADPWADAESSIIARGLDSIALHYRALNPSAADWSDAWLEPQQRPLVRIRVRLGDEAAERLLAPPVTAPSVPVPVSEG